MKSQTTETINSSQSVECGKNELDHDQAQIEKLHVCTKPKIKLKQFYRFIVCMIDATNWQFYQMFCFSLDFVRNVIGDNFPAPVFLFVKSMCPSVCPY